MTEPILTMRVEGMERLQKHLADPALLKGPIHEFLQKAGFLVEGRAKEKAPVDTGRLRASISSRAEETKAVIGSPVQYAPWVEFGSRPHFPPVSALETWARRHGFGKGGAFLIARAISRRGGKAQPYLVPALLESKGDIEGLLRETANEIEKNWGKGG